MQIFGAIFQHANFYTTKNPFWRQAIQLELNLPNERVALTAFSFNATRNKLAQNFISKFVS